MALTGVHVECGTSIVYGNSTLFSSIWSETVTLPGTTTQSAPTGPFAGNLVFRISAPTAAEVWVAAGGPGTPDSTVAISTGPLNTRAHLAANEMRDIACKPGFKLNASAVA